MINEDDSIHIIDMDSFESDDLETILHRILGYVKKTTNCDAGSVYLRDGDDLVFHIFQNNSFSYETIFNLQKPLKKLRFPICEDTETIAVESYLKSKVIVVDDIYKQSDFCFETSKKFDKEFNYRTKSILTAPLMDANSKEPIGVIQLINKQDGDKFIPFTEEDEEFITLSSYLMVLSVLCTKKNMSEIKLLNTELERNVTQRTHELEETQKKLIEQINRDPMTNLYNRRYFNEIIDKIFPILQRGETMMSLVMVDIDDFKQINDTHGHAVRDVVINSLADIFRNILRNSDISIRFGGEEFLLLLTNTNLENSLKISEKLRKNVEKLSIKVTNTEDIKFTISLGVSEVNKNDNNIDEVLIRSDKALYEAKSEGKNQVCYR
ncbi:MAG: sensor domain-containing diguanylate cyclase [Campylobacterota bacterium]|nr:sensor domain-containing diguanylate cyclase [Campylobacterota bacterium]